MDCRSATSRRRPAFRNPLCIASRRRWRGPPMPSEGLRAQAQRALQKVSHGKKPPGTAYPHEFQGNNPPVPLSQPLGLGQRDSAGRSPFHAADSRPSGATGTANGTPAGHRGTLGTPLPARYESVYSALESGCPALVSVDRWQRCVEDGRRFLTRWGDQAHALGWTARDLFGLLTVPEHAKPSFNRLSRYDETGLIWLLDGRKVLALTAETAAIHNPSGSITTYRRHHKPTLIVEAVAVGRRPTK